MVLRTLFLLTLGLLFLNTESYSQSNQQGNQTFSEDTIESVAKVYVAIRKVRTRYQNKLQEIRDPSQAAPLQRQRQEEIAQVIEQSGISKHLYKQVTTAAQSNRELYQRLRKAIKGVEQSRR